ncbi:uncharacterized protein BDCG_03028 [Blastomyces dermatitidis ER-3]|uniref:Uncharacterized protein n=1 Tax=Ajellomyces dermatitidis (strain ER-3 / ATCC MYA-2586) TaxID=559297 RepID=A0ABP2EVB3_AJEDR|nr:uncharacterized protein BDCG_03028 [Blastomyces dermatitidis ER-3]EEQ87908.1 hypothetical protein BDCG_03028 [Blastomyces dermatitidis ER-3]
MEDHHNTLFIKVYLSHANRVISGYVAEERFDKIRRAKIEMQILAEIEKSMFPMALRIAWVSMVVHTNTFDIYWLGQQDLHKLPKSAIRRIEPDVSLADKLISPSPSPSQSSSREPSPLHSGEESIALSDSETSPGSDAANPNPQDPEAPPTTPTKPTTSKRRGTGTAAKKPAGVRKTRTPPKKKLFPATVKELEKSTNITPPEEEKTDSKSAVINQEVLYSTDKATPSPLETALKASEIAAPAGALKNGQTASTSGRGRKQKNAAHQTEASKAPAAAPAGLGKGKGKGGGKHP